MKPSLIAICALFYTSCVLAQEWMPTSPVSLYVTEAQKRSASTVLRAQNEVSAFGFDATELALATNDTAQRAKRPYGFGRELDDHSPADYDGLARDTAYFFGYQFFIIGVLYVMPESISSWSEDQKKEYNFSKWRRNISSPRWDPDDWYINYILHPYWGLTYYTRGRERGLDEQEAFWYSFGLSALYEFGLEALFEPASIQDLIFTPVVGSTLGWYMEDVRNGIKSQHQFSFWDKTLLIATDPLGSLNTVVDNLFGSSVDSEVQLRAFYRSPAITDMEIQGLDDPYNSRVDPVVTDYLGVELQLHWH
jgi:hypothetical protein